MAGIRIERNMQESFFNFPKEYGVIVVGAGHAGCEAALAAARMGIPTLLLTQNLDTIAQMSCNPSIGGLGKGQIVSEIDAMGGEMGRNTDRTGLQFRMLNLSKGAAVWSPRAQCDKKFYQWTMKFVVEAQANLDLMQDECEKILVKDSKIRGILTKRGTIYNSISVILTTGTFLKGITHYGMNVIPAGRSGCAPANKLSESLIDFGFEIVRFKTGTPMRINARSIDFSKCEIQPGDEDPKPFSFRTMFNVKHEYNGLPENSRMYFDDKNTWERYPQSQNFQQIPCWLTWTNEKTHEIIKSNLHRSPLYSGKIKSIGPRYCPSIEDKVVKFPEKIRHQIFLEPEGYNTREFYVNGLFTSLPEDIQIDFIRTVNGLENAEIIRPGYAVEYDLCPPTQLKPTLETKKIKNLYFAGQINGTTGYEEAAGQGFVAGANAALNYLGKDEFVLRRDESYIGVLIDDLVTKGTDEPYRMFTSRAEYRLNLRWDNADLRLMDYGYQFGMINSRIYELFLRYKGCVVNRIIPNADIGPWTVKKIKEAISIEEKYKGYLDKEKKEIEKMSKMEHLLIPENLSYSLISGLLTESRVKLEKIKPRTLGQAKRIPGVTPADIQILWVNIEKNRKQKLNSLFHVEQ